MSVATALRAPVAHTWGRLVERALPLLRRHGVAFGVVLVASAVAQAAMMAQGVQILDSGDTPLYLAAAHNIATSFHFFDALRTPGYPLFLAVLLGTANAFGDKSHTIVAYAQAGLMVVSAVELYVLLVRLSHRRWIACLITSLTGLNLYITDWERVVRVEVLSYWIAVTVLLILEWYLRTGRRAALVSLAFAMFTAIMIRPNYIYFPAIIFGLLALRQLRSGSLRIHWKQVVFGFVASYALVGGYMIGYAVTNGSLGLTSVTNINQFGKVLEYRMYDESDNPKYAALRADVNAYVACCGFEPWAFVPLHPPGEQAAHAYSTVTLGNFANEIIRAHPIEYLKKTVPDAQNVWQAPTSDLRFYAPIDQRPAWTLPLLRLSDLEQKSLKLLPWLLALLAIAAWRHPEHDTTFMLLVMLAMIATNIMLIALGSYGEFFRLRSPLDFAMIVTSALLGFDLAARVVRKRLDLMRL